MKYVAVTKPDNNVLIHGDLCVTNLTQLYEAIVDPECTEINISKEFADDNFTYTALCEFVENCATIAPNVQITVEGTLTSDTTAVIKDLKTIRSPEEMIYALMSNPTKVMQTLHEAFNYYLSVHQDITVASSKQAMLISELENVKDSLNQKENAYAKLLESYNNISTKFQALVNRVNFRYEKTVKPDEMFLLKENKFDHILYLKEITRVHYTDTLVYYLQEILKTLYSVPTRVVVIEPYYAYNRYNLYKEKGFVPHWDLTYQDVYSGNIFMAGCQPKLLGDILQNSNHLQYLIILDRAGYMSPHVTGTNVTHIDLASDVKDLPDNYNPDNVITYSLSTLNIPYISNFDELSLEDRIQKYSSMPITQKLIKVLEETNV